MMDIDSYFDMMRLAPKVISPATLINFPDAKYRVYTHIKVEKIIEKPDYIMVFGDGFLCKIQGISLHILEGDIIWFRNFYKKNNTLIVRGELMIDRKPMKIKISDGIIPILKGKLIIDNGIMKLKTRKREINLKISDGWLDTLSRYINREIIIKNAVYNSNTLSIDYNTEVYLER
ncbi:MAG: hypothetical protein QXL02_00320 [Candidatus Anstonellales archaeon]